MKKFYLKMFSVLFLTFIGVTTYAQGTWKATGSEGTILPSVAIDMGIAHLTCMHSDATNVTGKSDAGATTVSYNGVTWDNLAMIQGGTNGMYYAFLPAGSGTLDISFKMGASKKFFILELTAALWTSISATAGDLAALTAALGTADGITGNTSYFALPSVYDTYHASSTTWDGTTNFHTETGVNIYAVTSFPVTANKTYIIGCFGSKLMLRGVYAGITVNVSDIQAPEMKIFPNPAAEIVSFDLKEPSKISIYNSAGILMKQQLASPSRNAVNISDLNPGLYFVRMNNNKIAQKLIIR
jgi:hypothetical protein